MIVACHQPNFMPWLGYFAKMARADVFVLLDDVQFTQGHNKHNWTSRVRIGTANGPIWLSMPIRRSGEGLQRIQDLQTDMHNSRWVAKMMRTLTESYRNTPHFDDVAPPLMQILADHSGSVCDTNIALIGRIAAMLQISTRLVRSSACLDAGASTERLVNLTLAEGGKVYLSGDGAAGYQEEQAFQAVGIVLRKLGFRHPVYPQRAGCEFLPGLSIFDALCFVGIRGTVELLGPRS